MTRKIHRRTSGACPVCTEEITKDGILLHKTRRQTHRLCLDCGTAYLTPLLKTLTNNLRQSIHHDCISVRCPGTYNGLVRNRCSCKIDVRSLSVPPATKLATDIFRLAYVLENPDHHICLNSNCGEVVESMSHSAVTECPSCNTTWCHRCLAQPFHEGMSCIEYEASEKNTDLGRFFSEKEAKGELKFCPQCRTPTEKVKNSKGEFVGCNKIACENCGAYWCWLCGALGIDYLHYNAKNPDGCASRLWEGVNVTGA